MANVVLGYHHPGVEKLLIALLQRVNHRVTVCDTRYESFLAELNASEYNLAILDYDRLSQDNLAAAKEVFSKKPLMKILLLTVYTHIENSTQNDQDNSYIMEKPFDIFEFYRVLDCLLRGIRT